MWVSHSLWYFKYGKWILILPLVLWIREHQKIAIDSNQFIIKIWLDFYLSKQCYQSATNLQNVFRYCIAQQFLSSAIMQNMYYISEERCSSTDFAWILSYNLYSNAANVLIQRFICSDTKQTVINASLKSLSFTLETKYVHIAVEWLFSKRNFEMERGWWSWRLNFDTSIGI